MVAVRAATAADLPRLHVLIAAYMNETFDRPWEGSAEVLARDFGTPIDAAVAERRGELVGFAIWCATYDFHHCLPGGELLDLFVDRPSRGRGVALRLVAQIGAEVIARGGTFVRGLAVGPPSTRRFYQRVAVAYEGADCIVGGRALRELAALRDLPLRELVRGLPKREANYSR